MKSCAEMYDRGELQNALDYCVARDLISANDFRDTLMFFRADETKITPEPVELPMKYRAVQSQIRSLDSYSATAKGGGAV
jgi:hypothetical protein